MKKSIYLIIALTLAVCMPLMFTGCDSGKKDAVKSFSAVVVEVNTVEAGKAALTVRPDEGSDELRSADLISFGADIVKDEPEFSVGDHVSISYTGDIMETYPAQLSGVTEVVHITDAELACKT